MNKTNQVHGEILQNLPRYLVSLLAIKVMANDFFGSLKRKLTSIFKKRIIIFQTIIIYRQNIKENQPQQCTLRSWHLMKHEQTEKFKTQCVQIQGPIPQLLSAGRWGTKGWG